MPSPIADESGTTLTEPSFGASPIPGWLPPRFYAAPDDPLVSNDFPGWWTRSFRLVRTAWRPLLLIQLISAVPAEMVQMWGAFTSNDRIATTGSWRDVVEPFLPLLPFLLIVTLLGLVTALAMQRVLVQAVTARPIAIGAALLDGLRRTPALLGWGLVAGLVIVVGLVCCVLPGVYLAAVFAILPVVVLLERGNAFTRSFQLFHGDFGIALSRVATIFGVTVASFCAEGQFARVLAPGPLDGAEASSTWSIVASNLLYALFALANAILLTPMLLTAYADMRARREPFSTAYLAPAQ